MVPPHHYSSKQLDHLGLVAGMCDELGIVELIDRLIPQDEEKRTVSIGQAVKAMVLNGLGFTNRALYLTPLFFRDKPVERLIGAGIEAEHRHSDVLGRALDAIDEYDPSRLYPHLAAAVVHTDGEYNSNEEPEEGVIHITQGYSRDHRPDLNQRVLQMICERQAGIPLLMQALSGNNSDKESFHERVGNFTEQIANRFRHRIPDCRQCLVYCGNLEFDEDRVMDFAGAGNPEPGV